MVTHSSGSSYSLKQYSLEVNEIDGIKKGSKIIAELNNNIIKKVKVRRVFS